MPAFTQVFTDFEIDGNVVNDGNGVDDWENIWEGFIDPDDNSGPPPDHPEATALVFIPQSIEGKGVDVTSLFTGGSKDINDISQWKFSASDVPDKDQIQNAYAGVYICDQQGQPNSECDFGDIIVYLGLDRYATNGDAALGFWILIDEIGGVSGTTLLDADGNPATHSEDDFLVQVDVVNGGSAFDIRLYKWAGGDGTAGSLVQLPGVSPTSEFCATATNIDACGAINNFQTPISTPWPYDNKKLGMDVNIPFGGMFEARFNLTELIGIDSPDCTAGFIAETRTSQSPSSQLKDIAFGTFQLCGLAVSKLGPAVAKVGDMVSYDFVIHNTGGLPLFVDSVVDDVLGDLTGTQGFINAGCDQLGPDEQCAFSVDYTIQETDADPLINTVTADYNPFQDLTGTGISAEASHETDLINPDYTVLKESDVDNAKAGDMISYTVTITNTGDVDLACEATDVLPGVTDDIVFAGVIPFGDVAGNPAVVNYDYTVPGDHDLGEDGDSVDNTVFVECTPDLEGFTNDIDKDDSVQVGLFEPGVDITKLANKSLSKIGDEIVYTITVTDTSQGNAPPLDCTVTDTLLGGTVWQGTVDGSKEIMVPYTVMNGDPDPLENTASVSCTPQGFPNQVDDVIDQAVSVNLFQPSVQIDKAADKDLSKVGDTITYTFTVTNTSSLDSPDLQNCQVTDSRLGLVGAPFSLAPSANTQIQVPYLVLESDPDPIVNTASVSCGLVGFPNVITDDTDQATSVNLFQPAVSIVKSADTDLSKIGDTITYTFTVTNDSSDDTPTLTCQVSDALLGGNVDAPFDIEWDEQNAVQDDYTVQEGDPDPLVNTASVSCTIAGFPNVLDEDSNQVSINLFQPSVMIEKTANRGATKVGDMITYTITVTDTSSDDAPPLVNCTVDDSLLGQIDFGAIGDSKSMDVDYTTQESDEPGPVVNLASVVCNPEGFPNLIEDGPAQVSLDILHPDYDLAKTCLAEPVPAGSSVNFRIDLTNTGDTALVVDLDDPLLSIDIDDLDLGIDGGGCAYDLDATDGCFSIEDGVIADGSSEEVFNEVFASATLPPETMLPNVINKDASDACDVLTGPTRTRGFWQTHGADGDGNVDAPFGYTCHVFDDHMGGFLDLGWVQFDTCGELLGGFWANNARDSDRNRRDPVCKTKVQTGKQAIAAALNSALDTGAPLPEDPENPGMNILQAWIAEAAGDMDRQELLRLGGLLDEYNNSGDDAPIVDFDGTIVPHADPNGVKVIMDISSVDCQP